MGCCGNCIYAGGPACLDGGWRGCTGRGTAALNGIGIGGIDPPCWPPPGAEDGGGGRAGADCCAGVAGAGGLAAIPCTPACGGLWPAIRTETKERDGGLDEDEDDGGDAEDLVDGGTEGANDDDGEADDCGEELGGDPIAGYEGLDVDRTLGLFWTHKD
jgi:hypothetical protein